MKKISTRLFAIVFAFVFFYLGISTLHASHLVGADLTYNCISGNNYELTLNLYRDCAGGSLGTTATIAISSGTCGVNTSITANLSPGFPIEVSAICPAQIGQTTCSGGSLPGIQQWQYKVIYTLPQNCTDWKFSYSNCCRNYAISTGPGGNSFYVEATLNSVAATCNSSPDFTSLPVPYMCVNQITNYNHGAFDVNGDSLVYSLITPRQAVATNVTYNAPYTGTYPLATTPANNFAFNTLTGQMTFTPALIQQSVCAVKVTEYRNGVVIGTVVRDIQMVVINCLNNSNVTTSPINNLQNATLVGTNNIRVCAGEQLSFSLTAQDPNVNTVINMVSNTGTAIPGSTFTTTGTNPKTGTFSWQTNSNSIGYWNFTITITDNNCPVPSVQVLGFTINVFGVDIAASDYTFCPGTPQAVQLDASVGGSIGCPGGGQCYSWSPSTGLSASNIPNPIATVSSPTSYVVTYNDGVCVVHDTVSFVSEGSVTVTPANPVVCSGTGIQLNATNTFPNNNNACGSAAGTVCNGPAVTRILGTATTVNNTSLTSVTPFNGWWHDSRMQMLFTAAELTGVGTLPGRINSLVLNIATKYSTQSYQGFNIRLGCTNLTALNSFQTGLTTVYTNTVNTFVGLNTYNFTTPYMWDGVSNLIVEICYNNTSFTNSDPVYYTATPFTSVIYNYTDGSVGCSLGNGPTSTLRPNIRFSNCPVAPPVNYTWTSIAGDPVSTLSGTNIANPLASPTQNTTYVVACDNGSCIVYDTVTVTMNPLIFLNDILDITQCPNVATTLTASGSGLTGFSWNTGQNTASINVSPAITTTYTVTATSACGNFSDNVTIFVTDTIPPVISNCPTNINVSNDPNVCGAAVSWASPTVTDNCVGILLNQTQGLASGSVFPIGTTTIEYIATDGSGNKDTCTFTVTVQDTELPVIANCPANIVVTNDIGVCGATINWVAPTVSDNCPNATIVQTQGLANGSVFPLGTSTIEYTATDASGNVAVCTFTITITDTELPVVANCPANISLTNDLGVCGATVTWTAPTTSDNCSANIVQTQGAASGTVFPLGVSTIEYTATDASGNVAVCTFTITITDTELPVINGCPANIAQTNDLDVCGATVTWTAPTTTDNCSANIVQTQGLANGAVFPLGVSTIEYTSTDASGNVAVCTFTITITDTELPVIVNCPANISVNNDLGVCGATVTWTAPTTTDNCSANIVQTQGLANGAVFPLGTSTIEYTSTDASGNVAVCTFSINVTDAELPVIANCPANIAVNNDLGVCGATINWTAPTVSDNCPNPVIVQTQGAANGTVFPLGVSTIEYTATDANGNVAVCTFTITVTDTELPVIANCPANIAVTNDLGVCGATITWTAPTTSDNCSANIVQTQGAASGTVFPLGVSTIEYTATDASGNVAVCTFTITVTDPEAPVINGCPANIVLTNDAGVCGATVTWTTPTTTDNCSANIAQTQGAASGTIFPLGVSTIEYTATDASGNTAVCTFTITITDTENPVINNCPANIVLTNDIGVCGATVTWAAPTTTDNCSANIVQTQGAASGTVFPLGVSTIEYTATDASGNAVTCSFTINITDAENPVINNCPANIAVNNDAGVCGATVTWTAPTVSDNCPNAAIAQTQGAVSGTVFPLGTSTIEYTATDANGNTAVCTFTITVTDTELPVILNCPANISQNAGPNCDAVVNWTAPTVSDNCPGASLTSNISPGATFPFTPTVVTYTATDAAGNTATCSFTVDLFDNTPPTITNCPANMVINLAARCDTILNWTEPTITDNCSGVVINQNHFSGDVFPIGVTNVNYTATDAAGNVSTCDFTITVIAPPAINATISATTNPNCFGQNGTATVSATGGSGSYNYSWNSSPAQNTSTASLLAGSYIGLVTDALATTCVPFDTVHVTITAPAVLGLTMSKNNLKCFEDNSGDATATVVGGTLPYNYSWSNNQATPSITNLAAGTYTVLVTDAKGCTKTGTVTLTEPDSLRGIVSQTNVKCFGDNTGVAKIIVNGGTSPYSYNWTGGVSTTGTANGIISGTYTVTVTDANLCTINRTFVITQPAAPLTLVTSHEDAKCFGTKTGTASVTASGGTPAYTYTWNSSPVQYTTTATNLGASVRTVTVKDANNCSATASETIGQPTRIDVQVVDKSEPYCDMPNGTISVSASGGLSPYTYQWDNGQTGTNASALLEGIYTVVATDANNCQDGTQVVLTNTPPPTALFSAYPNNSEPIVIQDATIDFTNLSTGAVAYQWEFGDGFTDNRKNTEHTYSEPGIYTVTLTAYNQYYQACPDTQSMTFEIIPNGSIYIPNVFTPNLDGNNDEFFISGAGIKEMQCLIFDRWGKMVYTLQSPADKWLGKNQQGQDLPEGTYTFKIHAFLNDGTTLERGGTIMLIR